MRLFLECSIDLGFRHPDSVRSRVWGLGSCCWLLVLGLTLGAVSTTWAFDQPNIILINLDDADGDLLSDTNLRFFPTIERLRREGLRFTNVHATSPLCGPSRLALLRGQYAQRTTGKVTETGDPQARGFRGGYEHAYEQGLLRQQFGLWMKQAGYRTMFVGKFLNNGFVPVIPPGWQDFSASLGATYYGVSVFHNNDDPLGRYEHFSAANYRTHFETDFAEVFLNRHDQLRPNQPVFMYLAPFAPHRQAAGSTTSMTEDRYATSWPNLRMSRDPDLNEADLSDKPDHYQALPLLDAERLEQLDEDYRNRVRALRSVDDSLQTLLAALEQQGRLDNTFIFLTSDNGYQLGHHRLTGKQLPFDRCSQVPMLVWGPGVPAGESSDQLLAQFDLNPTLVELAGGRTPTWCDAQSFLPLCFDPQSLERPWRSGVIVENWGNRTLGDQTLPATFFSLRQHDQVYTEWSNGAREYYNLAVDPFQLTNLYDSLASQRRSELKVELRRHRRRGIAPEVTLDQVVDNVVGARFTLTGVAESNRGLDSVKVLVFDPLEQRYWTGSEWQDVEYRWTARLAAPGHLISDWSLPLDLRDSDHDSPFLVIQVELQTSTLGVMAVTEGGITVDHRPPTVVITTPADGATLAGSLLRVKGRATDDSGIQRARLQVVALDDGLYWNGRDWVDRPTSVSVRVQEQGTWVKDVGLRAGTHLIKAWAVDTYGNVTQPIEQVRVEVRQ